jgi:hypothetical protein
MNKTPIDKQELKKLIEEVFLKPIETKRKLTLYTFDPRTILTLNQMMKEEPNKYLNNNNPL